MVTFELFARVALERLTGVEDPPLPLTYARLAAPFRHRTGLTRFLPAILDAAGSLTPLNSKGSSDVPALARGECVSGGPMRNVRAGIRAISSR